MEKKKTKLKKLVKAKKKQVCKCCGRAPSNKSKNSKVEKLIRLAKKNSGKKKEKLGFFRKLFNR